MKNFYLIITVVSAFTCSFLSSAQSYFDDKILLVGTNDMIPGAIAHFDGRVYISEDDFRFNDDDDNEIGFTDEANFSDVAKQNFRDYLLWVEKGIVVNDIAIVEPSNFPDYVFDDDYNLGSLSELKLFIEQNGHLPHIPSAKEVIKQGGYTVDTLLKSQLRTIEELTLHTLEQQDKINLLNQKVSQQDEIINKIMAKLNELAKLKLSQKQ